MTYKPEMLLGTAVDPNSESLCLSARLSVGGIESEALIIRGKHSTNHCSPILELS